MNKEKENHQGAMDGEPLWQPVCFYCGSELTWDCDYDGDDVGRDEDVLVHMFHCPHCGCSYETYECPPEERKEYPWWEARERLAEGNK